MFLTRQGDQRVHDSGQRVHGSVVVPSARAIAMAEEANDGAGRQGRYPVSLFFWILWTCVEIDSDQISSVPTSGKNRSVPIFWEQNLYRNWGTEPISSIRTE
jgi:hypothetical protein